MIKLKIPGIRRLAVSHASQVRRYELPAGIFTRHLAIFRRILVLLLLPGAISLPAQERPTPPTCWEIRSQQRNELTQGVTWLSHEPLAFLLRRGDHFDDELDTYQKMCAPENLKQMAAAGIHFGRLYFYKGFGQEYERANMEQDKQTAVIMHQLDMKVSLYVGGTMFAETLYRELPEARNWERRDQNNQWVPYGLQTFRHYACLNEPAYRDYLKKIVKYGVEEVRADQILFDNIMLQPEPESCHCHRCVQAFHDFLRQRYPTAAAVQRRFGLPNVDWIQPPEWDSPAQPEGITVLDDPVLQEWVRFRCESIAHYCGDLSDYIKSLNPSVSVAFNLKGIFSYNYYWNNAIYHPLFANHIDTMVFDTPGYEAGLDSRTGALASQIRSYKVARQMKVSCEEDLPDDLRVAVDMAFNYQAPGSSYLAAPFKTPVSGYLTSRYMTHASSPMLEFYREYLDRYCRGAESVADVAVLRTWPSMAYSINATYVPTTLMEQVLIQHQVPFDILFDENIDQICRYPEIIMPGQECVSDAQVRKLLEYVRNGGTLLLTGNTAQYNQWREQRHANPLLPARSEGRGRIVYIPEIIRADSTTGKMKMPAGNPELDLIHEHGSKLMPSQWVLPRNHEAIASAIINGLPNGLSVETGAPLTTVMNLLTRSASRETIVHFVNFDRANPLAPFSVTLRKQFLAPVKSINCFSLDRDQPLPLTFQETGNHVRFTIPSARLYTMIVVAQ